MLSTIGSEKEILQAHGMIHGMLINDVRSYTFSENWANGV